MKRIRHSPEQVIRKLREADAELAKGTAIPEVCKALGIDPNFMPLRQQPVGQVQADETGATGDEDGHRGVRLAARVRGAAS